MVENNSFYHTMIELTLNLQDGYRILGILSHEHLQVTTWSRCYETGTVRLFLTPEQVNLVRNTTVSRAVKRMLGTFSEEVGV